MLEREGGNKIKEVIGFIFSRLADSSAENFDQYFQDDMCYELEEAGFAPELIGQAVAWLNSLLEQQLMGFVRSANAAKLPNLHSEHAVRCYNEDECWKLTREVREILLQMDQVGAVDWVTREIIITQLMALDQSVVDVEDLNWVAFVVVCSSFSKHSKAERQDRMERLLAVLCSYEQCDD